MRMVYYARASSLLSWQRKGQRLRVLEYIVYDGSEIVHRHA